MEDEYTSCIDEWDALVSQYRPDPSQVYWAYRPVEDSGRVLGIQTTRAFPSTYDRKRPFSTQKSFRSVEEIVEVSSSDDSDQSCVLLCWSEGDVDDGVFTSSDEEEAVLS